MAGWFTGTVNFGGSPLVAAANTSSIFVAEFDCSGKHLWSKSFGNPPTFVDDELAGLATGADGSILLTGYFQGTLDFGTGPLPSMGPANGFIAKLDAAGNAIFAKSFGGIGDYSGGVGCALDQTGNAYVAAFAWGQQDFGGGSIGTAGQQNAVLVEFDATGNHVFSNSFGQVHGDWAQLALAPSGDVILVGDPGGGLDFGGGPLPPAALFAATLTASGSYVWAKTWGSMSDFAEPYGLAIGPSGEILFTGRYYDDFGTLDFGGGPLPASDGSSAAFVVKLTSTGAHVFSKGAGSAQNAAPSDGYAVAVNASGDVYLAGAFGGTIDFGGGPVTSTGYFDALFAKFSPSGALTWLHHFGSSANQGDFANSIALDAAGAPYVAGTYLGAFNLGNGVLPVATPGAGAFLGQLAP
jgi:hypothetical protein